LKAKYRLMRQCQSCDLKPATSNHKSANISWLGKKLTITKQADINSTALQAPDCSLPIVDTHAHLCDPVFDADREKVLERAHAAGISGVIAVGEDLADAEKNLRLAMQHPRIHPAAGLYPTHLDPDLAAKLCGFIRIHRETLVCIGEIGLDFWMVKDESDREIQRGIFRSFIALSKELSLPLNVHSRSAGRYAVGELLESGAVRVQMHAFDGKLSAAMPAVEAGFFFSIPPSIVRSEQKQKLAKHLPLSCLLIESDSPVLGPSSQERNEPANARIAVKAIAELKGIKEAEAAEEILENTRRLYGNVFS
jgi:TatD DNase family protein